MQSDDEIPEMSLVRRSQMLSALRQLCLQVVLRLLQRSPGRRIQVFQNQPTLSFTTDQLLAVDGSSRISWVDYRSQLLFNTSIAHYHIICCENKMYIATGFQVLVCTS